MIKIGIVGGAGYTAGELLRILIHHKKIEIAFVYSTTRAGHSISSVHQDLEGDTDLKFSNSIQSDIAVLFLCLGHGLSKNFLSKNTLSATTKIIDLSNDFRLNSNAIFQDKQFIYGLPELNYKYIQKANFVANPGCFATAIQLALLPLAANGLLKEAVHVNAVTGATGAGSTLSETTHFTWRSDNFSHYKAFEHQHMGEIYQTINGLQKSPMPPIHFIPNRGNFSRGIFATAYTPISIDICTVKAIYGKYYESSKFTFISEKPLHLKQVINTNKCLLHLEIHQGQLLITSILDNLLKGASGQAVQNMNLIFGFQEDEGLRLKSNYF